MSDMDTYHVVQGQITSGDTALLDQIQANLPDEGAVTLATEYSESRVENDDGTETLSARMNFARGETELPDGSTVTGEQSASQLFQQVANANLANKADRWELRHYESPDGAVTLSELEDWYEAHPNRQPTDEDGESYVPSGWNPENHTIKEVSN
jgi:hypothetical protein